MNLLRPAPGRPLSGKCDGRAAVLQWMLNPAGFQYDGPLAQPAEHRTFNPGVVGSTPTRPTKLDKIKNFRHQVRFGALIDPLPRPIERLAGDQRTVLPAKNRIARPLLTEVDPGNGIFRTLGEISETGDRIGRVRLSEPGHGVMRRNSHSHQPLVVFAPRGRFTSLSPRTRKSREKSDAAGAGGVGAGVGAGPGDVQSYGPSAISLWGMVPISRTSVRRLRYALSFPVMSSVSHGMLSRSRSRLP